MSVFNRKEKTLECLDACFREIEAVKADGRYSFKVYLTEDNCTDGTAEAVRENYPDVVLIHGNGSLYWNRGMIEAWKAAASENPEFYLWLNDDTIIRNGAFSVLLESSTYLKHKAIIAGSAVDSEGSMSYGGRNRHGKLIRPDNEIPVACRAFNGNLVLVPEYVYKILGTMDPCYSHSFGDYDYGVRAEKAGITAVIAPGILAQCNRNPGPPKWRDRAYPLKERYKAIMSPKGRPFKEQFIYDMRSTNLFNAVAHFLTLNLRVLFPRK